MKAFSKFFSLPQAQRILCIRLSWYLIRAEIILSLFPYSAARKLTFKQMPLRCLPAANPVKTLRCHLNLLQKICQHLPWSFTCLRQAVALRDSLAADGVEATLKIGMCRKEGEFSAHAWLECCNQEVLKNGVFSELAPNNRGVSDDR